VAIPQAEARSSVEDRLLVLEGDETPEMTPKIPKLPDDPGDNGRIGGFDPVSRSVSLGEQLSGRIGRLIDSGEFEEGGRLPAESSLAERFGVSRPIIREALSRLRSQGIIVSRRGSGSYVQKRNEAGSFGLAKAPFGPLNSLAQVKKCFEFRATIEGDAAYYAAQNRTPESLAPMRNALERLEAAIAGRVVGISADYDFHIAIARASGNEFFETVMRQLQTPIEFTINLARSLSLTRTVEHMLTIQAEHVGIFRAIEAGDGETARRGMRSHLDNACQRIFNGPAGSGGA
jgi:GntR family transcriptional regulator, transcriptional repressor for pyruvate dehydrogenase complex